jgi:hypothetical protein
VSLGASIWASNLGLKSHPALKVSVTRIKWDSHLSSHTFTAENLTVTINRIEELPGFKKEAPEVLPLRPPVAPCIATEMPWDLSEPSQKLHTLILWIPFGRAMLRKDAGLTLALYKDM